MTKLDLFQEGKVNSIFFFQKPVNVNHINRLKMKIYIGTEKHKIQQIFMIITFVNWE